MDASTLTPLIACIVAFLLGSIPFGLLVARFYKVSDLRSQGSGNIGTTNVSRVLGFWPAGAITLLLDLFKGMLPILLVTTHSLGLSLEPEQFWIWVLGFCAVAGHCYSPWLKFKGGKGVATGLGAILLLSPWSALVAVLFFGLAFALKRVGSLASLTGLMGAAVAHLVIYPKGAHLWFGAAMIWIILVRHEANINALLEGRESKF